MEKLRKVRSFSELRIGQIVVIKDCEECNRAVCRGMLVALHDDFERSEGGFEPGFELLPECSSDSDVVSGVGQETIDTSDVFIVEDGLKTGVREPADAKAAP